MLGNTRFISSVDIMFNARNKSGISAHPCIVLYLFLNSVQGWVFNAGYALKFL